jgi:hypothetical protein
MSKGAGSLVRILACAALAGTSAQAADVYRWIEAEKPILTNFPTNPFAPANDAERSLLSGGAWIGASGPRTSPLYAVYDVEVPEAGEFRFYARKFWKHGPYRVQFNEGPWLPVGADIALLDEAELRTHIVANWTNAGTVQLEAGRNRFRIESTANDGPIAFDCFLITNGPFAARGLAKPDERLTSNESGWFAWDPPADAANSPIDLRSLNEKVAGENGRILARGGRFVHETTGKPVRFWGINCGPDIMRLDERDLDRLAAMLASRGVNLVRLHGPVFVTDGKDAGKLDARQLARTLRAVQLFKRHGIYSTLSIYFPSWLKLDAKNGWPDYHGNTPFALLFFDDKFQAMYRGWWRAVLTTPEAITGVQLKDEPAVLSLEIQNEDSLFFWTFQPRKTIPTSVSEQIERRFGDWLTQRYGSIDKATARWTTKDKIDGDDFPAGRVGLMEAGRIESMRADPRAKDTTRFLFEVERDFYASTRDYLRDELGAKALVSATNWTTASDFYLTPIERAANLAGDFVDRHAYYHGLHEGERADYRISVGDTFSNRSALRFDPEKPGGKPSDWNPILDTSYDEHPSMVSELDWLEPNRFRAEAPLFCAALAAQQDIDALAFFAATGPTWEPSISKFSTLSPVSLGQWPAAAMIYRLGLVDESPITADVRLNLDELLDLGSRSGISSREKFGGRTRLTISDAPTSRPSAINAPSARQSDERGSLKSGTNLNSELGVFTVNAPKAKVVAGFLGKQPSGFTLGDISIASSMEYGAIAIVPLDQQPIESSKRLLVQVMSEQHNAGFKANGENVLKIESVGTSPILVRDFTGTITFVNGSMWIAQPLDQSGQPLGDPLPRSATLELKPKIAYYVLTPQNP